MIKANILAVLSVMVVGFSANAHTRGEAVDQTPVAEQGPAIVSLDCIVQMDGKTAMINPKCLPSSKEQVLSSNENSLSSCLASCKMIINVAASSSCYSRCFGGR